MTALSHAKQTFFGASFSIQKQSPAGIIIVTVCYALERVMDMAMKKLSSRMAQEKKDKRSKHRHIRWDKLDNTANLFPSIAGESMTNVYRISVTLTEDVDPELLQKALDIVLPKFELFNVRLRTGIFWYYFEENNKQAPRVVEEHNFPLRYIQPNKNNSYLFRVTYFQRRINLEVFHVLTDGMGGINFLRELTYQYLRLAHPDLLNVTKDTLSHGTSLNTEDSFVKNFKRSQQSGFEKQKAYQVKLDKLPAGELGVIHGKMPVSQLKKRAKELGVSINDYFIGCFMWSVYKTLLKGMPSDKPIRVAVPVNLRPYFNSMTTKNFFVMVSASFKPEREDYTFEEVMKITWESLHKQLNKQNLENLFSYSVGNQKNLLLRLVPLPIKNFAMKAVYSKSAYANTTTITNIGNVKIDEPYQQYIDLWHAFIAMSKGQLIKGCVCSYGDSLVFSFTSVFEDPAVQRGFFRKIAEDGIDVEIVTNDVYY